MRPKKFVFLKKKNSNSLYTFSMPIEGRALKLTFNMYSTMVHSKTLMHCEVLRNEVQCIKKKANLKKKKTIRYV